MFLKVGCWYRKTSVNILRFRINLRFFGLQLHCRLIFWNFRYIETFGGDCGNSIICILISASFLSSDNLSSFSLVVFCLALSNCGLCIIGESGCK